MGAVEPIVVVLMFDRSERGPSRRRASSYRDASGVASGAERRPAAARYAQEAARLHPRHVRRSLRAAFASSTTSGARRANGTSPYSTEFRPPALRSRG